MFGANIKKSLEGTEDKMEENQKKYLDRIVGLLVRETIIDYEQDVIGTPFSPDRYSIKSVEGTEKLFRNLSIFVPIAKYLENTYGLSAGYGGYTFTDEIRYVWDQYRDIIKDKIRNNER
jgi:hypothetical protein